MSSIEELILPESIEEIGKFAFANCDKLKKVCLENNLKLKTIGVGAFTGCRKLQAVRLPENLEIIGGFAFDNCSELTSVFF